MRLYITILITLSLLLCGCRGAVLEEHNHDHDHEGESTEAELSEAQIKAVGIELGSMERMNMESAVRASGVLAVNPGDQAVVAPLLPGVVTRWMVTEGSTVKKGTIVAYMQSPELITMQREYLEAKAEMQAASREYDRQTTLSEQGAGIRKNLEAAGSALSIAGLRAQGAADRLRQYGVALPSDAGSITSQYAVRADISGVITKINLKTGSFADMQTPLAEIVDNSGLFCNLQVFENNISEIKVGDRVSMSLTVGSGRRFEGIISGIVNTVDPETKSLTAKVRISDSDKEGLYPGMAVTAYISTGGEETDVLPESAVITSAGKNYVFMLEGVHDEGGEKMYHFEKIELATGERSGGYVAVSPLEALPEDALFVVKNAFYINSMTSEHGEHSH